MARKPDPTSVRQRAFNLLNGMKGDTRTNMMNALRERFPNNTERYNETLWASHRSESKQNGSLVEVYSISDIKNGKSVDPYIKIEWMFHPPSTASLSIQVAKIRFKNELNARLQIVDELL